MEQKKIAPVGCETVETSQRTNERRLRTPRRVASPA